MPTKNRTAGNCFSDVLVRKQGQKRRAMILQVQAVQHGKADAKKLQIHDDVGCRGVFCDRPLDQRD